MKQAFVSYSRKDKAFATLLCEDLAFRGLPVWIDLRDIPAGTQWSAQIEQAIQECPFFLLLLSPHSVTSEYVRREYRYALQLGKTIIPLLIEECTIPTEIDSIQYIDLRHYPGSMAKLLAVFPTEIFEKDKRVEDILAFLKSPHFEIRKRALNFVAHARLHEALDTVHDLLGDYNGEIRALAGYALDRLNNPQSIPFLAQALHDPIYDVRSNVGWALVHLGEAAVSDVIAVLKETGNPDTREMALMVLKHIATPQALEAVQKYR